MRVEIIETSGHRSVFQVEPDRLHSFICEKIGATMLDFVLLKLSPNRMRRTLMAVDDGGWNYVVEEVGPGHFAHRVTTPNKPINPVATSLYLSICKPGTTHKIVGDVAIFEEVEHDA